MDAAVLIGVADLQATCKVKDERDTRSTASNVNEQDENKIEKEIRFPQLPREAESENEIQSHSKENQPI